MKKRLYIISFFSITLVTLSCQNLLVEPASQNDNMEDFITVWHTVNTVYPLLEFKNIDWDSIYTAYLPRAEAARGDEMYPLLTDLLGELHDGHASLITNGGWPISTWESPRLQRDRHAFSPLVVRNYFSHPLEIAGQGNLEYEYMTPDIGYIYISTFTEGDWKRAFDQILRYFGDSKGLILDVRNNSGGHGSTFYYLLAKFLTSPVTVTDFSRTLTRKTTISPSTENQYTKPVVILLNGTSASAAEIFPALMHDEQAVTLIGDTTAGLGGNIYEFDLPSGKRARIINRYFTSYDGTVIEWNGVVPDIRVEQTPADLQQGADYQLEFARDYLSGLPSGR
ncbi:MAG: hypothetical protein K9N46_01760 [Candidatus Marinimicrobia bacterium]|nr:hypothetical protein [Candidatus Neomarinimicrobiota bacterium]MCF7827797.1 hypothetical protein [Candidatus Neomarinimicrobiota bacterium]MCF7879448.1 hypothetical protein [Candidatus Neomarinimicrobiota bacterium]